MANVIINDANLTAIGEAIRAKNKQETLYKPREMAAAILAIPAGGALPSEALVVTGDCTNRFSYNGWNWFINEYGSSVTTKDITSLYNMFYKSTALKSIPFDINVVSNYNSSFQYLFSDCENLEQLPQIKGEFTSTSIAPDFGYIFQGCRRLREIPSDFFTGIGGETFQARIKDSGKSVSMFYNCHSLRQLPDLSCFSGAYSMYYQSIYYRGFGHCYALDKIVNLPVVSPTTGWSSNGFYGTFDYCGRVKDITFETNEDETAKTIKWTYQTIDLTQNVGYESNEYFISNHNSGLTAETRVTDDASYQALKDTEDWWTTDKAYSRYNKESALRTIKSLPDASSVSNGVNMTIKFDAEAGSATDGGAIVNLTETEIVIAAEKGWTIAL